MKSVRVALASYEWEHDEAALVSQAAPGPQRKYCGQSTEVHFLAGPASLVVFAIILKPVKEGSGVLTHIALSLQSNGLWIQSKEIRRSLQTL